MLFQDAERVTTRKTAGPRVVVIGAGAVGLYAAGQLAARGQDVVVIEAGKPDLGRFAADSYTVAGRPHAGIRLGRARTLGGTTTLWGGQLVEFQPHDFNGRSWLPDSAWPISYDEIAPYYRPTYLNLGISPRVLDDNEVWRGVSTDRPSLGTDFEVFFTRWLAIPNFAEIFAAQIQKDERLSVLTGHAATGFRGTAGRVQAVRVTDEKGKSSWIEADTVILAAGTIENARLLLHTAADPAWDAPWSRNPNPGRHFQDHLGGRIGSFHPVEKRQFFRMFSNITYAGHKFQPKVRPVDEVLESTPIYNTQIFFGFESEISEHLVFLKQFLRAALYGRKPAGIGDFFRKATQLSRYLVPLMWKYAWEHRVFVPSTAKIIVHAQAEQSPCAESTIRIDRSVLDANGLPRVILDWRLSGGDLESLREFAVRLRAAFEAAGIGELRIEEDLLALNPAFLSRMGDTYHQAGGTVMGTSEQDGVVDRDLRVFGTENVYVTGAGIFRTASNANTTFTALTFTTRLVDHLTQTASVTADLSAAAAG